MAIFKSILTNLQPWARKGRKEEHGTKKKTKGGAEQKKMLASKLLW